MRRFPIFFLAALMAAGIFAPDLNLPVWALGKNVDVPRMTVEDLRPLIGNSDVVIIDVRVGDEWKKSTEKIQGAVREDPEKYNQWAAKYPKEKIFVFY